MLISVFFLDRAHNTHRWIHFGGFSFQPSELAKPALILFLAFFLENRTQSMDDWRNTLLPAILPTLVFIGLIVFQPDLGTAIACAAITVCILFVAGLEIKYLAYCFAGVAAAALFLDFSCGLPARPHSRIPRSVFRSPGPRLPHHSVADRGSYRRPDWRGLDGRERETLLSAGAAYRFYFFRARRRTGPAGCADRCSLFAIFLGAAFAPRCVPRIFLGVFWPSASPAWW